MQQAKAGLEAVYLSGWQVAADGNTLRNHVPGPAVARLRLGMLTMVRRINTFAADEPVGARYQPGDAEFVDHFLPIVVDVEAGSVCSTPSN